MKIGNHVKTIDWFAFYKCLALKNVTIPGSVTKIVDGAFYGCKSFTNITIPGSVKSVGVDAFTNCYSLKKITIKGKKTTLKKSFIGYQSWGSTNITATNPVVVIYGYKDSTAQKYANKYKLGFQTIGQKQAAKSAITSLASGKGGLQLQAKWKKVAKAYQYEIQIYGSADKYGYSRYVSLITKDTSLKVKQNKNLKKGKTYSVRVRAYAKNGGKQIVSPWSGVKKIKIKK